jgi:hypothetical protein
MFVRPYGGENNHNGQAMAAANRLLKILTYGARSFWARSEMVGRQTNLVAPRLRHTGERTLRNRAGRRFAAA